MSQNIVDNFLVKTRVSGYNICTYASAFVINLDKRLILSSMIITICTVGALQKCETEIYYHEPTVKEIARDVFGDEYKGYAWIIERESGWKSNAQNPHSTAFGIAQFLTSTWSYAGCEKTEDAREQLVCMKKYVAKRYGTVAKAVEHHKEKGWY